MWLDYWLHQLSKPSTASSHHNYNRLHIHKTDKNEFSKCKIIIRFDSVENSYMYIFCLLIKWQQFFKMFFVNPNCMLSDWICTTGKTHTGMQKCILQQVQNVRNLMIWYLLPNKSSLPFRLLRHMIHRIHLQQLPMNENHRHQASKSEP